MKTIPLLREVSVQDDRYVQMRQLRNSVLRVPIGLQLSDKECEEDGSNVQFALLLGATLLACVLYRPLQNGTWQLRQMAVQPTEQGKGYGAFLVRTSEQKMKERGAHSIFMHARKNAVGFYQKLGYSCDGDEFFEVGIPHFVMKKML